MVAILSPTIVRLLDDGDNTIVTVELSEEDNKKEGTKEGKKEIDGEDFIFYNLSSDISSSNITNLDANNTYLINYYTSSLEVFLPPPKEIS